MNEPYDVFWDWSERGNVAHIAEHGLSPRQVEQALRRGFDRREQDQSRPERWVVRNYTDHGLFIVVAFELEWVKELGGWLVTPVTAFEL